jgi:hypothetical protein
MPEAPDVTPGIAGRKFDSFLGNALDAHAQAEAAAGGPVRRHFRMAEAELEFRLAHPAIGPLFCDALAHIEIVPQGEPDFTFHIWDQASSGIEHPPACWDLDELYGHGEIAAVIDDERYLQVDLNRAMVVAADRRLRKAAVWLRSPAHLAEWEYATPLVTLINWWASGSGRLNIHAGAVGRPDGGILIVGRPGAGKSNTAIACLDSDLFYAADDHCLLDTKGSPSIASIYSSAKLYESDLQRFPIFQPCKENAARTHVGKAIFFLDRIVPDRLSPGFPIRAVVLPKPSGRRDTALRPMPASAALLLLGPYNALRWPTGGRTSLASLAATLRSLPCFCLETGTDMSQIPKTIASLLDT